MKERLGKTAGHCKSLAGVIALLVFFCWVEFAETGLAAHDDRILHLTPDKDRYFLGSYLFYLEDAE